MSARDEFPRDAGIGKDVPRKEDSRLLRGQGRFTDDLRFPNQAYGVFVRSPHAHARILSIDTEAARSMPGVLAVLTGKDAEADGLKAIPHQQLSADTPRPDHMVLPSDKARFVGEAVVMVVAESINAAKDAAERVEVTYEPLASISETPVAAGAGQPRVWDKLESNTYIDLETGSAEPTDAAFKRASRTVRLQTWVQRVTAVSMETRGSIGVYEGGRYELFVGSGGVGRWRVELSQVLDVPPEKTRIVSYDVGGNFGMRNPFYPEYALVCWAAKRVGRPVKWTAERSEGMVSDCHARDLHVDAEIALDAVGHVLAMRSRNTSNVGAHFYNFVGLGNGVQLVTGLYRIPAAHVIGRGVATNTSSTSSYRSAGRPEVMFVIERLMDLAARETGIDRVEIRRRNMVSPAELPFTTPVGKTFDSGEYEKAMDRVMEMADWKGFPARKEASRKRGKLRGLGLANYIEATAGAPKEWTRITVKPEGRVEVAIGTQSSGQSHQTSYSQLVNEWLGVPYDDVDVLEGDTDVLATGGGTQSGRSMRFASIIVKRASDQIVDKGRRIASRALEAAEADIEFSRGRFTVKGTDRSMTLYQAAAQEPLGAAADETIHHGSFPYGSHVCEVEVDPDTGTYVIDRYFALDDVGRAVSPKIVDGQTHGGIVQGLGQALMEHCHYDPESGQMLSGSLMDYALPRASDMPSFHTEISEVPSTTHPLGIRAGSESGTPPALCVAVSAIVDALSEYGVKHIEMPVTPEKVWRAMQKG